MALMLTGKRGISFSCTECRDQSVGRVWLKLNYRSRDFSSHSGRGTYGLPLLPFTLPIFPHTTMATQDSKYTAFWQRVSQFFLILGAIYVFLVALGTIPLVQRK
jgi:hypothetical protein